MRKGGHGSDTVWAWFHDCIGMVSDCISNGWGDARGQELYYINLNCRQYTEDKHQLNPVLPILVIYRSRTNTYSPVPWAFHLNPTSHGGCAAAIPIPAKRNLAYAK